MDKKTRIIQRMISGVLAICMVLIFFPGFSMKAEEETPIFKIIASDHTESTGYYDENDHFHFYTPSIIFSHAQTGDTVQLLKNYTCVTNEAPLEVNDGKQIILDLNGYVLCNSTNSNFFNVQGTNSKLTIIDSNPTAEHKYVVGDNWQWNDAAAPAAGKHAYTYSYIVANNIQVEPGDVITVPGGAITGSHAHGAFVNFTNTLEINGGSFIGFQNGILADGHSDSTTDTTIIMTGGNICGCGPARDNFSGGISVINNSKLVMTGGTICYNTHGSSNGHIPNAMGTGGVAILGSSYNIDYDNVTIKMNKSSADPGWIVTGGYDIPPFTRYYKAEAGGYTGDFAVTTTSSNQGSYTPRPIYAVTYMSNKTNGVQLNLTPGTYTSGFGLSTLPDAPAQANMIFTGWVDSNDVQYTNVPTTEAKNLTLYAVYESAALSHSITYMYGDTELDLSPATYTEGTGVDTLPEPTAPANMEFVGWFDSAADGNEVTSIPTTATTDYVLYARFQNITYTITYMHGTEVLNIPGAPSSFDAGVGVSAQILSSVIPTLQTGEVFEGWFTSSEGGTAYTSIDPSVTNDVILYAHITPAAVPELTFTTFTCGGYISNDNEVTKTPVVGFGYQVDQSSVLSDITDYGIYIYKTSSTDGKRAELSDGSIQDLADDDGRFYAYVTASSEIRFYSMAYATIGGVTYYSSLIDDIGNYEYYVTVD